MKQKPTMTMADKPATTEAERRKRQAAADFARASVGLEGFKPSEAEEQRAARFVAGETDLAEFVNPAR